MELFLGAFTEAWEQRRAAYLHERLAGRIRTIDEEKPRRRSVAQDDRSARPGRTAKTSGHKSAERHLPPFRPMSTRFTGLASGSQPAVVKLASFAGGGRLGAMARYISRDGEVVIEDQAGDTLAGREKVAGIADDWAHLMGNRAESRDIGCFRIDVASHPGEEQALNAWASDIVTSALGARSFAFAITEREGQHRIDGVVVLRDRSGERLSADAKAEEIIQRRMAEQGGASAEDVRFRFTGYGNGVDYGAARLRQLVEDSAGAVMTDRGETIADAKRAGELVQLQWRGELHSRKPRDVMHLVMSARSGTDAEAFRLAAREFLAAEFRHHRYVFSLHDPARDPKGELEGGKRPHVHVHAIVAMRSEDGERVETSIASFRRWRAGLAEQARAHGIRMEMTDRREQASAPAFNQSQVRPISHDGRTEHEGTSAHGRRRYQDKRREVPTMARTAASLAYSRGVHMQWSELARGNADPDIRAFADRQVARLETALGRREPKTLGRQSADQSQDQLRTVLLTLSRLAEVGSMKVMTRSEFDAYEQRVEASLSRAERLMQEKQPDVFKEIAAAARDHVGVRREILEQAERMPHRGTEDGKVLRHDDQRSGEELVVRQGLEAVEAGNRVLAEIHQYRERLNAPDGEDHTDKRYVKASLDLALASAATLCLNGNDVIREAAEVDEELRLEIERAERSRDRTKAPSRPAMESQAASPFRDHADRTANGAEERRRSPAENARGLDHVAHPDPTEEHGQRIDGQDRERREDDEYDR
ncbi:relaxase/mobilization nuclease domain-containing protein [Rhizobium grahamii]|uniref:Ti-type conjugative transfer relaxase TraA n=1 Tax=Rhizobium grahamii CCGE 502 TaxID=990285 RepID=S3H4V5_9HYPH|nr:hypothetical protein [Rhizobium grahamii]EPE94082.1 Ti-type conjugative transfer relaxase TraA [Rhizobium grahamii CCGE 502]